MSAARVTGRERHAVRATLLDGAAPFQLIADAVAHGAYVRVQGPLPKGEVGRRVEPVDGLSRDRARRALQSCMAMGQVTALRVQRVGNGRYRKRKRPMLVYALTDEGRELHAGVERRLRAWAMPGTTVRFDEGPPDGLPRLRGGPPRTDTEGDTTWIRG